jgi:hypothetical protein
MCRVVVIAAVSGCLWSFAVSAEAQDLNRRLFASEAVYELHLANPAYRSCDANKDGAFQPAELPCYDALPIKASYLPPPPIKSSAPVIIDTSVEAASKAASTTRPAAQVAPPDPLAASNKAFLIVRRSRDAIGSFASPKPFGKAAGAEFAWADDYIADNEVWSARGIVAASFVHQGQVLRDDPYIKSLTLAPYVDFDRVSNSTKITDDVDNLTYGGVFEAGFANVFGATQYLDISGEVVTSFAGETKNWSIDLEWQPVGGRNPEGGNTIFSYLGAPQPFGRYFVITASPSLQAEYVAELGEVSTQPIFAEHNEAFRAGPAVTLALDGIKEFDYVPWWIQRIHYEISYGWLYDFLSGRDYALLDTSLTFALDPKGHFGLTFSYRNGQLVATGQDVDLANIALSVSY